MSNQDLLMKTFAKALGIEADKVVDTLTYDTIPQWDSVAHMQLVGELEIAFDIMLDTDDILDMSSVGKAKEILAKYDVEFP